MSKGPPPPIKPKPKNLPPVPAKKPDLDKFAIGVTNNNVLPSSATNNDDYIASLRGTLRKTRDVQPRRQATDTSIVSNPITMSINPDALDSDESQEEENREKEAIDKSTVASIGLSPFPLHPISHTPLSPFKKDNSKLNGYPIPPQRNQTAIASTYASNMASPLRKSSRDNNINDAGCEDVGNDTLDYAEGMRSPLKKNISFPPPPKRNTLTRSIPPSSNSRKEIEYADDASLSPSFSTRGSAERPIRSSISPSAAGIDNDELIPPELPVRKEKPPAMPTRPSASSKSNSRQSTAEPLSEDDYYSDEYADERSIHVVNQPKTRQTKHISQRKYSGHEERYSTPRQRSGSVRELSRNNHNHNDYNSSSEDDGDYGYDRRRSNREDRTSLSSSQLLQSAKTFSMESLQNAKEKSGPLANKAINKLSKMKDKLKNSSRVNDYDEYSDDDENDRYRSMKRDTHHRNSSNDGYERKSELPPEAPRKPERPASRKPIIADDANKLRRDIDAYDVSIDEDRPPLPDRKSSIPAQKSRSNGVPLPGLTDGDDLLKPPHKIKPEIVRKLKPEIPVKNSEDLKVSVPTPPANRTSSTSNSSIKSSVPPPPPSRTKVPNAPPSRAAPWKAPDLNLELTSLWWIKDNNSKLPKDLQGLNYQLSHGYVGTKEFKIYGFRLQDLGILRLKLVWKKGAAAPLETLTNEVEYISPPSVTRKLLIDGNEKFAEHIANWCEVKEGSTVGNGECWTLAHDALEKSCGKYAFVSTGLIHGANIATFTGTKNDIPEISIPSISDDIRRGDILQFKTCVFKYPQRTMTFGAPDHTAIVLDVKPSDHCDKDDRLKWLEIIHQNVGGVKKVRVADIDLGNLESGELKVFRPVEASWVPDLSEIVI